MLSVRKIIACVPCPHYKNGAFIYRAAVLVLCDASQMSAPPGRSALLHITPKALPAFSLRTLEGSRIIKETDCRSLFCYLSETFCLCDLPQGEMAQPPQEHPVPPLVGRFLPMPLPLNCCITLSTPQICVAGVHMATADTVLACPATGVRRK